MKIAYFGFEWGRVPSNVTLTNTTYAVGQGRFPGSPIGLQGAASASVAVALTSATSVYGSFWLLSSAAFPATTNIINIGVVNLQILSGTSIAIQVNGSTVATQTISTLTQGTYLACTFSIILGSSGSVSFTVDGNTVSWSGNTVTTSSNVVTIQPTATTFLLEDVAINDGTTTSDNGVPPFIRCGKCLPIGNGTVQNWTASGSVAASGLECAIPLSMSYQTPNYNPVTTFPNPIKITSNGKLFFAGTSNVYELDPYTNNALTVTSISTGTISDFVYLSSTDCVYLLVGTTIIVYSVATKTKTTITGPFTNAKSLLFSPTTGKIYACGSVYSGCYIYTLDPTNNTYSTKVDGVGSTFGAFEISGNVIFCPNATGVTHWFNISTSTFVATTFSFTDGYGPLIAYITASNEVYFGGTTNGIKALNPSTFAVNATITTSVGQIQKMVNTSLGVLVLGYTGTCLIDPSTHAIIWSLSTGNTMSGFYNSTTGYFYVGTASNIYIINSSGTVVNSIGISSVPQISYLDANTGRIYFANNSYVYVINTNNFIPSLITSPTAAQAACDQSGAVIVSQTTAGSVSNFILQPSTAIWPGWTASSFQGANISATQVRKNNSGSRSVKLGVNILSSNTEIGSDVGTTTTPVTIQRSYLPVSGAITVAQGDAMQTYLATS